MVLLQYRTASDGYWVGFMLPLAIFLSRFQFDQYFAFASPRNYSAETNETIKLTNTKLSENMVDPNVILIILTVNTLALTILHKYYPAIGPNVVLNTARIFNTFFAILALIFTGWYKGHIYKSFAHGAVNFVFPYVFYHLLAYFPKSFTFGEAITVAQGFCAVFWVCALNVPSLPHQLTALTEQALIILLCQVGLLSIVLIARLLVITKKPWTFMFMEEFLCIWAKCCLVVVVFRIEPEQIAFFLQWMFAFFFATKIRMLLFAYWTALFVIALSFIGWAGSQENNTSTVDRKVFHFLIVAVYLPGVFKDYNLLFESTVALTYIFLVIELIRYLDFELYGISISKNINISIGRFRDKQDEGKLFLTPIYLLIGCSMPLWFNGVQLTFDQSGWSVLGTLAGVLSVGVGDTFASIGGSKYGRIRWEDNGKSVEGTIFSIVSQLAVIVGLQITGFCSISPTVHVCAALAVVLNSLVETKTDQIDNFSLPLVFYNTFYGLKMILHYSNVTGLG